MAIITAIANQKGGVGKTTTTLNLGAGLAKAGKRVLLCDFDPQGNLSSYIGFEKSPAPTMSDLLSIFINVGYPFRNDTFAAEDELEQAGQAVRSAIRRNDTERLDYIPSTIILSGAEQSLMNTLCREQVLSKILSYVKPYYDYILIDCPPSLGILSINALTAADEILVPVQAQNFALDGLIQLMDTFKRIRSSSNPALRLNGFLVTMVNNTRMSRGVIEALTEAFGEQVYKAMIAASTEAPTSTVEQKSLKGRLGLQYAAAAFEYISRQGV